MDTCCLYLKHANFQQLHQYTCNAPASLIVLTLVDKSGSNKRVAPRAPPRRTIRSVSTQNAGSYGDDSASQNQSFPGTPDPQAAQEIATSDVPTRVEPTHVEDRPDSGARTHGDSTKEDLLGNSIDSIAPAVRTPASSRTAKAPTVLSTAPHQGRSSPNRESQSLAENSGEVATSSEPAQTPRQTRASKRSLRGIKRAEPKADAAPNPVEEVNTTSDITLKASDRRRKVVEAVQSATANGPAVRVVNGDELDPGLEQANSNEVVSQVPPKKKARSEQRITPVNDGGVLPQSEISQRNELKPSGAPAGRSRSIRKRKQNKSAREAADEVIDEATGAPNGNGGPISRRKRKGKLGSEEAENHEIIPAEVKMADLVKDQGLGKTSKREIEMRKIDWEEVKRKRREAEKEAAQEEQKQKEARKNGRPLPQPGPHVAERLVLINGQMVIDESSRVIDRNADTARDAGELEEAIDEDHLTKRVNQATVGRKPGTIRTYSTWDDEETEQFYQGLRMFGTDFMMISKMFPGTSRALIKKKYTKEEKLNPEKIFTALNSKVPVDLKAFSEMTETVYEDPQDFYKELEEQQARLEAEDAKTRADEAEADQEIQQSIEQAEEGEGTEGEHPDGGPSARKNRYAADAESIMGGTDSRKKKSKKTPAAKKKEGKKGKGLPAEGTEEIVGRIEDVSP
jgi:transcription factor TFIIIB component B''